MVKKIKILIVTDAWYPQVNGVVTTYSNVIQNIDHSRYDVELIEPSQFKTIKLPFYKEIGLALVTRRQMRRKILENISGPIGDQEFRVHIATEGPLGYQARRVLEDLGIRYTTAYHTKFPEFIQKIAGIPTRFTRWYFDWFHKNSKFVLVQSHSVANEHPTWNTRIWGRGYDDNFFPSGANRYDLGARGKKVLLYVGRVSKEKSIEDFCSMKLPNTEKVVVGNGPLKSRLEKKYPDVKFVGYKFGSDLAEYYRSADVFVFPSRTDTFGIVILEAMACGTPVAAYPVTGPIDQIVNGVNGYTSQSLSNAVLKCFAIDRSDVYNSVKDISWEKTAHKFVKYLKE